MDPRIEAFRAAGQRAVDFQLQYQQPDGSFIWDEAIPDAYHKQSYSWGLAGRLPEAHRLINWIASDLLVLADYRGDVYKLSWMCQGVHRLGRFDVSHHLMDWLVQQQTECGGFPHFAGDQWLRCLPTAWAGVAALYLGHVDVAGRAAAWCLRLLDQPDEGRYYYRTTLDGRLATPEVDPGALFIDMTAPRQPYWEIGLPIMLMDRLFMATADPVWRERANLFFELHLRCAADRFAHTGSGKSSLAAALHWLTTGDERARAAAFEFGEYLLATQRPEGSWTVGDSEALLIRIDAAAEFNVWLQEIAGLLGSATPETEGRA